MSFPRYPEYKPSGIDWTADIPSHWTALPLKRIARLASGESISSDAISDTGDFPVFGGNGRRGYTDSFTHEGFFPLIGRQGALCGNINYAYGRFWASEHAVVAAPYDGISPVWLGEALRAMNLNQYSVSAAQPGLAVEAIAKLRLPVPPAEEQAAIAAFLDREATKIDALVAEQEKLIALLKEKRQAVISHAVTKGLNPDAPMKPSGIEWLGDVPAHWEDCFLKRTFASVDYGISETLDKDSGVAVLRMGNIQDGKVVLDDLKYVESVEAEMLLEEGDLLFNRTNSIGLVGKVGLFVGNPEGGTSFASYLVRLRLHEGYDVRYFSYLLNTNGLLGLVRASAFIAIGQCNLNPTKYGELRVAVPPIEEQRMIAEFLDTGAHKFDALQAEAECAIALLKERRAALISAAVTGQIDVRGLANTEAA